MNILHNEKILAELLNKVIDGYSIGMGKLGSRSGFTPEAFNGSQIILVQGPQDFDRNQALLTVARMTMGLVAIYYAALGIYMLLGS